MFRKIFALIMAGIMAVMMTGCNTNKVTGGDIDAPVTGEVLNTASDFVVRGFIESIFNNDRDLFEKCFPESVIANSNELNIDLFEQYRKSVGSEGRFLGTQYMNFNDLSKEGGYKDADSYRASISIITGIPEDQITTMHIEHIKVYFDVNGTNRYTEIYALAYESNGSWYVYELQDNEKGFNAK